jgi:hypothetical protein
VHQADDCDLCGLSGNRCVWGGIFRKLIHIHSCLLLLDIELDLGSYFIHDTQVEQLESNDSYKFSGMGLSQRQSSTHLLPAYVRTTTAL